MRDWPDRPGPPPSAGPPAFLVPPPTVELLPPTGQQLLDAMGGAATEESVNALVARGWLR